VRGCVVQMGHGSCIMITVFAVSFCVGQWVTVCDQLFTLLWALTAIWRHTYMIRWWQVNLKHLYQDHERH